MKFDLINACTDLGVHIDGAKEGANLISEQIIGFDKYIIKPKSSIKETVGKLKNLKEVNNFNKDLFDCVKSSLEKGNLPVILGGDHSLAIGSALASINHFGNLGIIWLDSHGDYNTEDTTITGNIHGLPFAAITGFHNEKVVNFYEGPFFNTKNAVLVGARSLDEEELKNLNEAGVTIFTTEDIKEQGMKTILDKAFSIASRNTTGIHISYDLDLIDPIYAPGVSIPEENGINLEEDEIIHSYLCANRSSIKSLDLVEFNPLKDIDNKTLNIAVDFLNEFMKRD